MIEGTGRPLPVVDGTSATCTGVIAGLENALRPLPEGASVRAIVADVPTRVDVLAWAERHGHAIPSEFRDDGRFHLTIVKGGRARPGSSDPGGTRAILPGAGRDHRA